MLISDWSSDVCSSDLSGPSRPLPRRLPRAGLEHACEGGGAGVAQFVGYQRHGAPEREFALGDEHAVVGEIVADAAAHVAAEGGGEAGARHAGLDRKSTRLNSSH